MRIITRDDFGRRCLGVQVGRFSVQVHGRECWTFEWNKPVILLPGIGVLWIGGIRFGWRNW